MLEPPRVGHLCVLERKARLAGVVVDIDVRGRVKEFLDGVCGGGLRGRLGALLVLDSVTSSQLQVLDALLARRAVRCDSAQ